MYLRKAILLFIHLIIMATALYAQSPAVEWQKCLGGNNGDYGQYVERTNDGGYILAGFAYSSQGDLNANHGLDDFWVIKLNASGDIQWQKSLGGGLVDRAYTVHQTADGGYIVAGSSFSHDGDVSSNRNSMDYWIVKLDNNGNVLWEKTYGGARNDFLYSLQVTSDGYILAGSSESIDGDVTGNLGGRDFWIVKVNVVGAIQWQKSFGGSNDEEAYAVQTTNDGGYIVAGYTLSNDGDVNGNHGAKDCWMIKLNSGGNLQWQKCMGTTGDDEARSVQQASDGGFIMAGYAGANDGDVTTNHGSNDFWAVKLNAGGNLQWQKCFGGSSSDQAYSVATTPDGGYVMAGFTQSDDGDVTCHVQDEDYWVVKINATGDLEWQKDIGGVGTDAAYSIKPTSDGGYMIAGFTTSSEINGYHPELGNFGGDFWVVKLSGSILVPTNPVITISAPSLDICTGTSVTFTASTNLTGTNPRYIWERNGAVVGTNSQIYTTNDLADGDNITCRINTIDYCIPYTAMSNTLSMAVSNTVPPSIVINSNVVSVCSGIDITFFATVTNGHGNPVFQWKLNGMNVGTNSGTYSGNNFKNGDLVSCTFTDISPCSLAGINSNVMEVQVAPQTDPTVEVTASGNNICTGTPVTFTATPSIGSGTPAYQWKVNGNAVGTNSNIFVSGSLVNGDVVNCTMINDPALTCINNATVVSNDIVMTVTNALDPVVNISASDNNICSGVSVHFTALAENAGTLPSYQWKINNINAGNNSPDFTTNNLGNGDRLTCDILPASNACSSIPVGSNTVVMTVKDVPAINMMPADTVIRRGDIIQLHAMVSGNFSTYQWDPADKLTDPLSLSPTTTPVSDKTIFTLRVTGANNCSTSKISTVKITGPLYMPNAFTPNGDGKNDLFKIPPGVSVLLQEFSIFDRWGNKIFATRDPGKGWDGTNHGVYANTGVYVYVISGTNEKGNFVEQGSFILIR